MTGTCALCTEQRDMVAVFGEEADTDIEAAIDAWHDRRHPDPGPFLATAGWYMDGRGPDTAEAVDISEFELGPKEVLCTTCWLVHRPGSCDR